MNRPRQAIVGHDVRSAYPATPFIVACSVNGPDARPTLEVESLPELGPGDTPTRREQAGPYHDAIGDGMIAMRQRATKATRPNRCPCGGGVPPPHFNPSVNP